MTKSIDGGDVKKTQEWSVVWSQMVDCAPKSIRFCTKIAPCGILPYFLLSCVVLFRMNLGLCLKVKTGASLFISLFISLHLYRHLYR